MKMENLKNTLKPTVTELHLCESSGVRGSSSVTAAVLTTLCVSQLSVHRGQLQAASGFLHQAVVLAHQTHNNQAIIYTYSLDDNAVIEMSLKLATIYAEQNKAELAEHGFRFCMESLEVKLEKHKELLGEEKETRLLLGLCLDSRARYRASTLHLKQAGQDYQDALNICCQEQGETHPQTLVLMSDLATILDLQGHHDDALALVRRAVELSRSAGHPDLHVLLGNMAGILLHTGEQGTEIGGREALGLARQAADQEAVDRIQEGLKEVKERRRQEEEEAAATAQ
uniref:Tetratricopeptide repeat domain 19 n=1 Tax=Pundamilia nyererei TaxID=303518 RepID=A0A3B4H9A0_9CICH